MRGPNYGPFSFSGGPWTWAFGEGLTEGWEDDAPKCLLEQIQPSHQQIFHSLALKSTQGPAARTFGQSSSF